MDRLLLTRQAAETMLRESRGCPTETGGVLVGTVRRPAVLVAGPPGRQARKGAAFFATDPEQDRMVLLEARRRYGGRATVVGYWHKHPRGMTRPSSGDLAQARRLLAELRDGQNPWLAVVIVEPEADRPINPYVLAAGDADFVAVEPVVKAEAEPEIQAALRAEPGYILPERGGHFWADPGFCFQLTPAGAQRLEREQALLQQAGYRVQLRQRKADGRLCVLLERAGEQILCLLPPEYPLGMPRFFRLPAGREVFPLRHLPVWNSDLGLVELLAALDRAPAAGAGAGPAGWPVALLVLGVLGLLALGLRRRKA